MNDKMPEASDFCDLFKQSLHRIVSATPTELAFFDVFYQRFIQKSDDAADAFRSVRLSEQAYVLKEAMNVVVEFYETKRAFDSLTRIARRHSR